MKQILEYLLKDFSSHLRWIVYGFILVEWLLLWYSHNLKKNKESWISLFSYILESIPYLLLGKVILLGTMQFTYDHRFFELGNQWYIWLLAFLLYDFMFYLIHYLGHQVRFFWCIHGVHHTPKEMKLSVAIRGSFLGFLLSPHTIIWIPLLGFPPYMLIIVDSFSRLYGLFEHVNDKLFKKPHWIEFLFITPSSHRVHHARNHFYLDRNYGEVFSIWDRLFGTFQKELPQLPPEYGLMDNTVDSENLKEIQLGFWKDLLKDIKQAPDLTDKLKYLFMPPGWNHIDGGKLANEYRSEAQKKYK